MWSQGAGVPPHPFLQASEIWSDIQANGWIIMENFQCQLANSLKISEESVWYKSSVFQQFLLKLSRNFPSMLINIIKKPSMVPPPSHRDFGATLRTQKFPDLRGLPTCWVFLTLLQAPDLGSCLLSDPPLAPQPAAWSNQVEWHGCCHINVWIYFVKYVDFHYPIVVT